MFLNIKLIYYNFNVFFLFIIDFIYKKILNEHISELWNEDT